MATVAIGRRGELVARATTDRALLRAFLERDRLYAAYAHLRPRGAGVRADPLGRRLGRATRRSPLVLEYNGPTPQPLFVMGQPDGIAAILRDVIRPRAAYVAARPRRPGRGRGSLPRRPRAADGPHVGRPGPLPPVPGDRPAAAPGRDRRPQPALPAGLRLVAAVGGHRRRRLLRHPRQRPLVVGGRHPRRQPVGPAGGRRQRHDPHRLPWPRVRDGRHRRRDRRAAAHVRPGRAQRPLRQPAGPRRLPPPRLSPSTPASRSASSTASARPGRTSRRRCAASSPARRPTT